MLKIMVHSGKGGLTVVYKDNEDLEAEIVKAMVTEWKLFDLTSWGT